MNLIKKIKEIRGDNALNVISSNTNYNRIMVRNNDGSTSAYYFSCPIYREKDGRLVDFKFERRNNGFYYEGVNTSIVIDGSIRFTSLAGTAEIVTHIPIFEYMHSETTDIFGQKRDALLAKGNAFRVLPTANGLAFQVHCDSVCENFSFDIKFSQDLPIYSNGRFLSFMIEQRLPFITLNAVCAKAGNLIVPLTCSSEKLNDTDYRIAFPMREVCQKLGTGFDIMFTVDAYLYKMVFDTTIEKVDHTKNNSYGSIAFLGKSDYFDEQKLLTRIDNNRMHDLAGKKIRKATMYMNNYSQNNIALESIKITSPWCTFGTTWENQPQMSSYLGGSFSKAGLTVLDMTNELISLLSNLGNFDTGKLVKARDEENGLVVCSTGDDLYFPQIIEVNFDD